MYPGSDESGWYVLQTKPHQEALVEQRLSRDGIPPFLPRIAIRVRAGRYLQRRIAPMFPRYLFVRAEIRAQWKTIRYTPGVRDFLRCDGEPHPVSEDVVATLRTRVGPGGVFSPPVRHFSPGERLRIEEGPLQGLDAIFQQELSGPERVAVLLTTIGFPARVILSTRQLASA